MADKAYQGDVEIFDRSDLVSYGHGECGEEVVGEVAYILAEARNGKRWIYVKEQFELTEKGRDEDGFLHSWRKQGALEALKARIEDLQATLISEGLVIDGSDDWQPTSPCYGSESWTQEDELSLMDDEEFAAYMGRH